MPTIEKGPGLSGLRALAHPLRLRLLSLLTAHAMSASEAARELGEKQANVSYHLRQLHAAGFLDLVEETSVRGGRAKRYRHDSGSGEAAHAESGDDYAVLTAALADEMLRRSRERATDAPGAFTDAEMWLPADAWARALRLAGDLGVIMHDEALPPGTEGAVRASATLMLFEMNRTEGAAS